MKCASHVSNHELANELAESYLAQADSTNQICFSFADSAFQSAHARQRGSAAVPYFWTTNTASEHS